MNGFLPELPGGSPQVLTPHAAPSVACDVCSYAMPLPSICIEQGAVLGLLVCTACVEDQLEAQAYERTCQAH